MGDHSSLEKPRDVVGDRRDDDSDEQLLGALHTAHARVERPADGHVSIRGDEQNRPDGHRLAD